MNREIEYRAWDKETKLMFEVLSIDFQNKTVVLKPMEEHNLELYNFSKMSDGKFVCGIVRKFSEVELEEYTRKNDKNDKKIFEGDIVKGKFYHSEIGVVEWESLMFKISGMSMCTYFNRDIEVIGNIHDNKTLLEETYGNN